MKFYQSPLLITSFVFFVYGIYLTTDWGSGPMGWGYLAGVVILIVGLVAGSIHLIARALIKNKLSHFLIELSIVLLFFTWLFFNS
jgi:hypothetical protein